MSRKTLTKKTGIGVFSSNSPSPSYEPNIITQIRPYFKSKNAEFSNSLPFFWYNFLKTPHFLLKSRITHQKANSPKSYI